MRIGRMSYVFAFIGLMAALLLTGGLVRAADHTNLEEGLPIEMEDAYPIAYHGREFQFQARWERTAEGDDQAVLDPRLELGFARNWQAKIDVPFRIGSGERRGSGDIGVEALYNFNTESLSVPAFALAARADFPTGEDSSGVDPGIKFIVTKTLGRSYLLHRLNLNIDYTRNSSALAGERKDLWKFVLGYMRRVGPDTIFLTDFVSEQEYEEGKTANLFELGVRRQTTPLQVLVIGASVGLNSDAPDFRLTFGMQQSF